MVGELINICSPRWIQVDFLDCVCMVLLKSICRDILGSFFCKVVVWICWEVFPGIFWQVFVWICWKVIAKTHKLLHLAPLPNMLLLKLEIVWISQNFPNLNILHPNAANTQKEFVTKSQTCSSSKFPKVSHILKVWAHFDVIIRPKSRFGIIQSRKIQ